MSTLTAEQIQEKKLQIVEKLNEIKQLRDEIVAAGDTELTEDELDNINGGGALGDAFKQFGKDIQGAFRRLF